ncbi:MAG: hypothetical protein K0Q51_858 [Rickettsiaceae bacterium]|jgi:hypothetical protein|nr:hypothetical protein [Rickettsiaceae bacterium]
MVATIEEIIEAANADIEQSINITVKPEGIFYRYSPLMYGFKYLYIHNQYINIHLEHALALKAIIDQVNFKDGLSILDRHGGIVSEAIIEKLSHYSHLKILEFYGFLTEEHTINLFHALKSSKELFLLSLSNITLGKAEAISLAETLGGISELIHLSLGLDMFTTEGITVLANALKHNKTLESIDLSTTPLLPHPLSDDLIKCASLLLKEAFKENISLTSFKTNGGIIDDKTRHEIDNYLERNSNLINSGLRPIYSKAKFILSDNNIEEATKQEKLHDGASHLNSHDIHILLKYKDYLKLLARQDKIIYPTFIQLIKHHAEANYLKIKGACKELAFVDSAKPSLATLPLETLYKIFSYNIYSLKEDLLEARQSSQKPQPAIDVPEGKKETEDNTLAAQEGHNIIGDHSELN